MNCYIFVSFLLLLIMCLIVCAADNNKIINVGTSLYRRRDLIKMWTDQEVIRLQSRMIIEQLLPTKNHDGAVFIKYMKLIMNKSDIIDNNTSRKQIMIMVADIMGGYMYGVLLPKVKMTYYEGHVGFNVTNKLYEMMRKIKFILDTDGRGWISSSEVEGRIDLNVVADGGNVKDDIIFRDHSEHNTNENSCGALYLEPSIGLQPIVPAVPAFDNDQHPGSLVVPFANGKRLFSVDSPGVTVDNNRIPLLVRYYMLATRCTSAAPDPFRRDIRRWIDEAVVPLLRRNRWYPVLAGVSHVIRAVMADTATTDGARRKRIVASQDFLSSRPIDRDDKWPVCDDGPHGRLPNTNVFLFVVWLSLTSMWLCFGVFSVHKMIRFVISPLVGLVR